MNVLPLEPSYAAEGEDACSVTEQNEGVYGNVRRSRHIFSGEQNSCRRIMFICSPLGNSNSSQTTTSSAGVRNGGQYCLGVPAGHICGDADVCMSSKGSTVAPDTDAAYASYVHARLAKIKNERRKQRVKHAMDALLFNAMEEEEERVKCCSNTDETETLNAVPIPGSSTSIRDFPVAEPTAMIKKCKRWVVEQEMKKPEPMWTKGASCRHPKINGYKTNARKNRKNYLKIKKKELLENYSNKDPDKPSSHDHATMRLQVISEIEDFAQKIVHETVEEKEMIYLVRNNASWENCEFDACCV
ncbi:hypothetical protein CBL_12029 [Carabus blaptoides fortunei]